MEHRQSNMCLYHILKHISSIFGAFLEHIWSISQAYLEHFWSILYSTDKAICAFNLGPHLEHFWSTSWAFLEHIWSISRAFLEHIMEHGQSYMCLYHILKHISSIFGVHLKHISSIFGAYYGAPTKLYVPISYFEAYLEHFSSIFGAHLKHISSIFGAFLEHIMKHKQIVFF
jgi:hypothetical protein